MQEGMMCLPIYGYLPLMNLPLVKTKMDNQRVYNADQIGT